MGAQSYSSLLVCLTLAILAHTLPWCQGSSAGRQVPVKVVFSVSSDVGSKAGCADKMNDKAHKEINIEGI